MSIYTLLTIEMLDLCEVCISININQQKHKRCLDIIETHQKNGVDESDVIVT